MLKFLDPLFEDKQTLAKVLQTEAMQVLKKQINMGSHLSDGIACAMGAVFT